MDNSICLLLKLATRHPSKPQPKHTAACSDPRQTSLLGVGAFLAPAGDFILLLHFVTARRMASCRRAGSMSAMNHTLRTHLFISTVSLGAVCFEMFNVDSGSIRHQAPSGIKLHRADKAATRRTGIKGEIININRGAERRGKKNQ